MQEVRIRRAVEKDIPLLLKLLKQLFQIEGDFSFAPDRQQNGLEMMIDSQGAVIMVAENGETIVGMATGQVVISTAEGCNSLLIEDVVIADKYQRRGIGRKLLLAVGVWGEKKGAKRMQLLADKNNGPAANFYKKDKWVDTALICLRKYH